MADSTSAEFVDSQVAFLYASQTGNAESISYSMYEAAVRRGFQAKWHVLDDHSKIGFDSVRTAVFVVSTTGDGDPPDNSARFWRVLRKATRGNGSAYSHLRFAVLGLGDTNYSNFCNTAQRLDKQLLEAGATAFYPKGLADDGTGLEDVVEAWIEGLWPALARVVRADPSLKADPAPEADLDPKADPALKADPAPEADLESKANAEAAEANSVAEAAETNSAEVNSAAEELEQLQLEQPPLVLDFGEMESLKAITGAPRVPSEVCEVEYVPSPAFSPPSSSTFPPWHEALNAETLANEALANETLDGAAPFLATLRATTLLTAPAALKRTLLAELLLDSASCGGSWRAGDSFSIYAPNDERLVLALLARLAGGSGDAHRPALLRRRAAAVELPAHLARFASAPARLGDILRWACDVSAAPRRQLLRALADHCGAALDRDRLLFLSSRQGAAAFGELRRQAPTTLDLLRAFPSCRPPAARLLELLPPLAPRAYSLCCAPGAGAGAGAAAWRFAFSVVDYCVDVPGAALRRRGVCTPWLELLPRGSRVLVARRRSAGAAFRLPPLAESRRPIIMVGPGTGVAPFVGFLEQRANEIDELNKVNDLNKSNELSKIDDLDKSNKSNELNKIDDLDKSNKSNELIEIKSTPLAWLFFGCRSSACDFLFRERLEQWRAEGVLGRLSTCFSRDAGAGPRYVQDAMAQHEEELMRLLLAEDALLFVCGDAKGMGRDVHAALAAMLCRHSAAHPALFGGAPLGPAQALELLARWASERRYLRDLWS